MARPLAIAILVVLAVSGTLVAWDWLVATLSDESRERAAIVLLESVKVAYLAVVPAAALGLIGVVVAVIRARRRGGRRPRAARVGLLCASLLFGAIAAEAGAGAWRAWNHRSPPLPFRFEDQPIPNVSAGGEGPSDGTIDVVVIGGSTAQGHPFQPRLSIGQVLAWQLGRVVPERRFRAVVLARPGAALEEMHQKLATLRRRPDVLVVYSGHNEFQSRWPRDRAVRYYDDDFSTLRGGTLVGWSSRLSPFCGLIQEVIDRQRLESRIQPTYEWRPIEGPATTAQEYDSLLADFRRRLESIAADCERIGTLLVFVIPAGNDADFEPDRSYLAPGVPLAEREALAREFLATRSVEDRDPGRALAAYRAMVERYPRFAEAHYRAGRLLQRADRLDEARGEYVKARDLDGMPIRCPSPFREAYRRVAARHPGVILIDAADVLSRLCPDGLLDDHAFGDGHHPTLRGHVALSQAVLDRLRGQKSLGWPADRPSPTIDPAECVEHFGIDRAKWVDVCRTTAYFYKIFAWLRHDPSFPRAKQRLYEQAAARIAAGTPPEEAGVTGLGWRRGERAEAPSGEHRAPQRDGPTGPSSEAEPEGVGRL